MKTRKYLILVALVSCGIFWRTVIVWANGEPEVLEEYKQVKRSTLRGLQGLELFVMGPKAEIEKYGLTESQIRTDVELKLRQAGVRMLSSKERFRTPGAPLFTVFAFVDKQPNGDAFLVNIRAELTQSVLLERDRSISCNATTWQTWPKVGLLGSRDLQSVRQVVKDHVDEFINDYLAANPKEQPTKKDSVGERQ